MNELKLIYGTGNPAKLAAMKRRLQGLEIEIVSLRELAKKAPIVAESGKTPLENARMKAFAYYKEFGMPVFSCDSGLYFDGLPEEIQPGVHVRNVGGRTLSDQEMIDYYVGLARKYGDLKARYRNAIVLVMDAEHIYEAMEENMGGKPFLITSRPHKIVKKGFPLDSLSIDISTGKYYYDLQKNELDEVAVEDGFLLFFEKVLADWNK